MSRPRAPRGGGAGRGRPGPPRAGGPAGEVLYGRNPVREALRAGRRAMHRVWATSGAAREPWLAGLDVEVVGADELAERAGTDAHQGLCALVSPYPYADAAALLAGPEPWLVALDEVQDPQNVGAICRTAECAGADGVVLPERRAAAVTPAVAKASAGAVEHLAVARVRNLADFLLEARGAGCWSYGAAAVPGAVPYDEPTTPAAPSSSSGRRGGVCARASRAPATSSWPCRCSGRIESLNVSAAAAVLLYEILHRRPPA